MRLAKLCPTDPRFPCWVALAYHALVSEPPAGAPTLPAPHPITGGGRGWGLSAPPPAEARKLGIAEMLLTRALDSAPPAARDSEVLGLLIHTMARQASGSYSGCNSYPSMSPSYALPAPPSVLQGKARAAYDLVIGGRFKARAALEEGSSSPAIAEGAAAGDSCAPSPWNGRIPFEERAPDEDVLDVADGSGGAAAR